MAEALVVLPGELCAPNEGGPRGWSHHRVDQPPSGSGAVRSAWDFSRV